MSSFGSILEELSFPRLSGSAGEARAGAIVEERFKALGFRVWREKFAFRTGGFQPGLWAFAGLILLMNLSAYLFVKAGTSILPFVLGFLELLILVFFRKLILNFLSRRVLPDRSGGQGLLASENILAEKAGAKNEGNRPVLVLMAHYDSKSQPIAGTLRIALALLAAVLIFVLSFLFMLSPLHPGLLKGISFFPLFFLLALSLLVLSGGVTSGNRSPGAQDNATGIAALLEAAEILSREKEEAHGPRVLFAATGAEEQGLAGAFAFREFSKTLLSVGLSNAVILNFDCVGATRHGLLAERGNVVRGEAFHRTLKKLAREAGMDLRKIPIAVGFLTDHMAFSKDGMASASLVGLSSREMRVIHSSRDKVSAVNRNGIHLASRLAVLLYATLKKQETKGH